MRAAEERQDGAADPARPVVEGDRHLPDRRPAAIERKALANEPEALPSPSGSGCAFGGFGFRGGAGGVGTEATAVVRGCCEPWLERAAYAPAAAATAASATRTTRRPALRRFPNIGRLLVYTGVDHFERWPGRSCGPPPPASQSRACPGRRRRSSRSPPRRSSASRRSGRCSRCSRAAGLYATLPAKFITGPASAGRLLGRALGRPGARDPADRSRSRSACRSSGCSSRPTRGPRRCGSAAASPRSG